MKRLALALLAAIALMASTGLALARCASPTGNAGDIVYSSSDNIMAYCNGTNWVNMGSTYTVGFGTLTTGDFCLATSGTAISCTTSAINMATQTSGILPSANGGTGVNNGTSTITLGGNLTTSGAYALTLTTTGATNVTLPTSGTLVNSAVTALSSLASVGTITTGVWNGTVIGVSYGGTGTTTQFTQGSVVFAGASGVYSQDNANFFWDATNHRLGLGTSTPASTLSVNGSAAFMFGSDYTTTGNQSDVNLGNTSSVRYNGTAAATFYGIVAGTNGQILYLHNASGYTLTLSNQSTSDSTVANRIITGTGSDLAVASNSSVVLQYDSTASRWRVIGGAGSGGGSSGTVWEEIASTDISSATTSYTFSGLSGDTDGEYMIVGQLVGGSSTNWCYLQPNGDTSTSDYENQWEQGTGTTLQAGTGGAVGGIYFLYSNGTNHLATATAFLYAKSGYERTFLVQHGIDINGSSIGYQMATAGVWTNTSSQITSIQIGCNQTNGLGVGTHLELWAKRTVGGSGGSASAAGSNGEVQFNNAGAFGADTNMNWDNTNKALVVGTGAATPKATTGTVSSFVMNVIPQAVALSPGSSNNGITVNTAATGEMAYYSGASAISGTPDLYVSGSNIGIGTSSPTNLLSLNGSSAQTIWMERGSTTGNNLTLQAGGGLSGGTNENGGNLILSSGISTGTGTSQIQFQVYPAGSSGTTDNTASTAMTITSGGNVGIGTTAPAGTLQVNTPLSTDTGQPRFLSGGTTAGDWNEILLGASIGTYRTGIIRYIDGAGTASSAGLMLTNYGDGASLFIQGGGNVGIGTMGPTSTLDVRGTIYTSGAFAQGAFGSTGNNNGMCYLQNGVNGSYTFGFCSSLRKYKADIDNLNLGLETVEKLRPVSFVWKNDHRPDIGFIAEEVEKIDPILATYDSKGQLIGVKYRQMTALLTKAIQQQQAEIKALQADNDNLRREVDALQAASVKH